MPLHTAANPDGWVQDLPLPRPSLQDNTGDVDRLVFGLQNRYGIEQILIDLDLMREIPDLLRVSAYHPTALIFQDDRQCRLVALRPAGDPRPWLGLAIDLGTTRITLRLLDLVSAAHLAEVTVDNPQVALGPDILTRIHLADAPGGLSRLQQPLVETLNQQIAALCRDAGGGPEDLLLVAVAGNTAMTHLLLGLPSRWIIREPYIPAVNSPGLLPAAALGLQCHPRARVYVFPNVGSYFGGDVIAGILVTGLHQHARPAILVDVGTNAEVVLGHQQWLMACAGAAGPALEGGVTRMGTMAGPGVIDRVRIQGPQRTLHYATIGGQQPRGICGSGLIDLAAALFRNGMVDIRGKLVPETCGDRYQRRDDLAELVVAFAAESATGDALVITQSDLDSLIRSKAAMYTILETLLTTVGMTFQDLDRFYVAGAFGTFIDPESAVTIGMLPDLPRDRFQVLGNSSLEGATRVLLSRRQMAAVAPIRDSVTYLELNVNQDFMNRFSAARFLPHTESTRFPSVIRSNG